MVAGSNPVSPTKKLALNSGFAFTFTFPQGSEVGLGTSRPSAAVWNGRPTAFVRTSCALLHVKCDDARAETAVDSSALDRWSRGLAITRDWLALNPQPRSVAGLEVVNLSAPGQILPTIECRHWRGAFSVEDDHGKQGQHSAGGS